MQRQHYFKSEKNGTSKMIPPVEMHWSSVCALRPFRVELMFQITQ